MKRLLEPMVEWAAVRYQAAVAKELTKYGLRYEDLYDPMHDLDVAEALRRLPQHEVDMRNQRLRRAHDLSLKHDDLAKELQEKQTPYAWYLKDTLTQIEAENAERYALGSGKTYDRQLP